MTPSRCADLGGNRRQALILRKLIADVAAQNAAYVYRHSDRGVKTA